MRRWIAPPLGTAVAAHLLAWVVSVFFVYEIAVVADDSANVIALLAIAAPVLLTAVTLFCAARLCWRTLAWVLGWIVLAVCIVGFYSIGLFFMPVAGLMLWTANYIPHEWDSG